MALPVLASSGVAVFGTVRFMDVPFPSGINSGDLLIFTFGIHDASGINVPSGFTLIREKTGPFSNRVAVFKKVADGTETGDLTYDVGTGTGPVRIARMHRYTGADTVEADADSSGTSKTIDHPDVVTTSTDRLVLSVTSINDDDSASSFTGETGGDFTLTFDDTSTLGDDEGLSLQTAGMVSSGTISGGTWVYGGATEDWCTVAFAIFESAAGSTTDQAVAITHTIAVTDVSTTIIRVFTSAISHTLAASTALITIRVLASPIAHGLAVFPIRKISVFKAVTHTIGGASTRLVKLLAKAVSHAVAVTTSRINIHSFVSGISHALAASTATIFTHFFSGAVTHSAAVALVKTIKLPRAVAHAIAASTIVTAIRNFTSTITHTIGATTVRANFFTLVSNIAHAITVSTLTPTLRFFTSAVSHAIAATLVKRMRFTKTVGHATAATSVKLVKLLTKAVAHVIAVTTVRANKFVIASSIAHELVASTTTILTHVIAAAITHTAAITSAKVIKISKSISHSAAIGAAEVASFFSASSVTHTIGVVTGSVLRVAQSVAVSLSHVASLATLFIDGGGGPTINKLHRRLRAWRKMFN